MKNNINQQNIMISKNTILVPSLINSFSHLLNQASEGFEEYTKKSPDYELYATASGWTLRLDAPGLTKNDIHLHVEDSALHVVAEHDFFPVNKTFSIGEDVDVENIQASLKNGVLELTLPKTNPKKTITID